MIERPASVVKELVENSVDAGADRVEVRIEGGGLQRILVSDNGCGIPKEELPLALKRHATSKVKSLEELEHVVTLGFRGEALASIDSVADLRIQSRTPEENQAWQIREGAIEPASGMEPGTRIEVKDLFYKTPARRKFMKSESTENAHVVTQLERIALANPSVSLTLFTNGRQTMRLERVDSHADRSSHHFEDPHGGAVLFCERPLYSRPRDGARRARRVRGRASRTGAADVLPFPRASSR